MANNFNLVHRAGRDLPGLQQCRPLKNLACFEIATPGRSPKSAGSSNMSQTVGAYAGSGLCQLLPSFHHGHEEPKPRFMVLTLQSRNENCCYVGVCSEQVTNNLELLPMYRTRRLAILHLLSTKAVKSKSSIRDDEIAIMIENLKRESEKNHGIFEPRDQILRQVCDQQEVQL